jgi:hypothetical protein
VVVGDGRCWTPEEFRGEAFSEQAVDAVRSKGFDFRGGRRGCPRGDTAMQFVDANVDECGVGGVEGLSTGSIIISDVK